MIIKVSQNYRCKPKHAHCANRLCTTDNQLVDSINKFARCHANVFIKVIVHAPSRAKPRHFRECFNGK